MAKKEKWIQKADLEEGSLTAKAKRAGFTSWEAYCNQPNLSAKTQRQCNLAKTLTEMSRGKK